MDYEKKYKELVGKIEKAYLYAQTDSTKAVLEEIRPELKESEDEIIRKNIIIALKSQKDELEDFYKSHNTSESELVSWLEKQGEKKSIDMSIKEKAHQIAWETSKHYDPLLSKESWCEMAALDMASWLGNQGEQKTVWSEEDEEISKGILNYLCLHDACELEGFDEWYEWLKDIKYRVQSKQEWSKEDERMRQYVVSDLKFIKELANDPYYAINVQLLEKEIEWMKSLKGRAQPQNTWKPSDEQMKALRFVKKAKILDPEERESLNSLYIHLKKLKRE